MFSALFEIAKPIAEAAVKAVCHVYFMAIVAAFLVALGGLHMLDRLQTNAASEAGIIPSSPTSSGK